ncbi:peptidylprolyl isomerase [Steroidobacter cummioxidans]|uniref:peptidylprolyl isomerase n=1 Tax=Steroidobacter cummioxidans TaxID=1803913 RepID=UPI00137A64E5|nr:peptidyl-prolyl cis-trans isomerase [Steroidobacter cummioxidans]
MSTVVEAPTVAEPSVSHARSLAFSAIGAIVGLSIAGYGLFTAAGTSTRSVPNEAVALINGQPILRGDFSAQLENETGETLATSSRDTQLKVLNDMVREELLVQRSLELNFGETDQDVRNALVSAVMRQITVQVATANPAQQQLRAFYDQHPGRFTTEGKIEVRDFLVSNASGRTTEEKLRAARAAAEALRSGSPVQRILRDFDLQEPQRHEEDYYFAVKYRLGDALFAQVRELHSGQVSDPQPVGSDVHIVQVLKNEMPQPLSFEAAADQVLTAYKEAEQMRLMEATIKFLRSKSSIVIAKDYASDYQP